MQEYFATLPTEEASTEILKRIEDYYSYLHASGRLSLWRNQHYAYYKPAFHGARIYRAGNQLEYSKINVSHLQNIVKHVLNMTTQDRPAWEPRAVNSDHVSQAQTIIAKGLLDYYLTEKKLDKHLIDVVEYALIYGEGFLLQTWETDIGPFVAVDQNQELIQSGDIQYKVLSPVHIVRDPTKTQWEDLDWLVTRTTKNKFALVKYHPELTDDILNQSPANQFEEITLKQNDFSTKAYETDDIIIYTFYHKAEGALPEGRIIQLLQDGTPLADDILPYKTLPVHRITAAEERDTSFGYALTTNLMAPQEALDNLYSTIITNQSTFGVQSIWSPLGVKIEVEQLADGLNHFQSSPEFGPPQPLNLLNTGPEIFNTIEMFKREMELIAGINPTVRGMPESASQSGAALALLQATALQYNSGLQRSYHQLIQATGTALIDILKQYVQYPRVIEIVGKSNRPLTKEFHSKDLSNISRVTVEVAAPMSKTTSGKLAIAQDLLQAGALKTPDEYLTLVNTGTIEPLIEGAQAELLNIKAENEALSEGQEVPALFIDNHALHIKEHSCILASPESRINPELRTIVLAHIQEHLNLMQNMDPALAQVLGHEVPPPQPSAPAPPEAGPTNQLPLTGPAQAADVNMPNPAQPPPLPDVSLT